MLTRTAESLIADLIENTDETGRRALGGNSGRAAAAPSTRCIDPGPAGAAVQTWAPLGRGVRPPFFQKQLDLPAGRYYVTLIKELEVPGNLGYSLDRVGP